jgi:hypothetical protein
MFNKLKMFKKILSGKWTITAILKRERRAFSNPTENLYANGFSLIVCSSEML